MKKKLLSFTIAAALFISGGVSITSNFAKDNVVKKSTTVETKAMAKSSARKGKGTKGTQKASYLKATGAEGEVAFKGCYININTDNKVLAGLGKPDAAWVEGPDSVYDPTTNTNTSGQFYCFKFTQPTAYTNSTAELDLNFISENNGAPKFYGYTLKGTGARYKNITVEPYTTSQTIEAIEGQPDWVSGEYCSCCTVYRYNKSNGAMVEYVFSFNELQCISVYNANLEAKYKR